MRAASPRCHGFRRLSARAALGSGARSRHTAVDVPVSRGLAEHPAALRDARWQHGRTGSFAYLFTLSHRLTVDRVRPRCRRLDRFSWRDYAVVWKSANMRAMRGSVGRVLFVMVSCALCACLPVSEEPAGSATTPQKAAIANYQWQWQEQQQQDQRRRQQEDWQRQQQQQQQEQQRRQQEEWHRQWQRQQQQQQEQQRRQQEEWHRQWQREQQQQEQQRRQAYTPPVYTPPPVYRPPPVYHPPVYTPPPVYHPPVYTPTHHY
jgi:hypothetical protein